MEQVVQSVSNIDFIRNKYPKAVIENDTVKVYSDVKEEYRLIRKGVGVRNISGSALIKLNGNETLDFLHRISTNAVKDLKEFNKINTLFTNDKGRFIDRATLLRFSNYFILVGSKGNESMLQSWLERYIIMEDIKTEDVSSQFMALEILGPQAESYLTCICGESINSLNDNNVVNADAEGLNFYLFKKKEKSGFDKIVLLAHIAVFERLINYFIESKSVFDFGLVGEDAYNSVRIEEGIPEYPGEINDDYNPHEAGLIDEVSFTKGCYIGQEVIARLDTYDKVQRILMGVIFENGIHPGVPMKISDAEKQDAGSVTSITHSELLDKHIGLAYVRRKALENPEDLTAVDSDGKSYKIRVVQLPFAK